MADVIGMLKRGKTEMAQESAKTDGMTKGGPVNTGGKGPVTLDMRGGKEYAQMSAKTDGCCK
jgi:hypothetical protein